MQIFDRQKGFLRLKFRQPFFDESPHQPFGKRKSEIKTHGIGMNISALNWFQMQVMSRCCLQRPSTLVHCPMVLAGFHCRYRSCVGPMVHSFGLWHSDR